MCASGWVCDVRATKHMPWPHGCGVWRLLWSVLVWRITPFPGVVNWRRRTAAKNHARVGPEDATPQIRRRSALDDPHCAPHLIRS